MKKQSPYFDELILFYLPPTICVFSSSMSTTPTLLSRSVQYIRPRKIVLFRIVFFIMIYLIYYKLFIHLLLRSDFSHTPEELFSVDCDLGARNPKPFLCLVLVANYHKRRVILISDPQTASLHRHVVTCALSRNLRVSWMRAAVICVWHRLESCYDARKSVCRRWIFFILPLSYLQCHRRSWWEWKLAKLVTKVKGRIHFINRWQHLYCEYVMYVTT